MGADTLLFFPTKTVQMSFSKGKDKINGIGPSSAKKMKEFAETGTMEKLEEKRKMAG